MFSRIREALRCDTTCVNFQIPDMEKAESSIEGGSVADLEDRDPNNLNQHIQVRFIYES